MNEVTAEATVDIDAPRTDVWRSLTEPERIKEYYLGADVQTDWQVGSPITRDPCQLASIQPRRRRDKG